MKFIKKMVGIRLERKRKTAYSNIERMIEVDSIKLALYVDLIKVVSVGEYIKKGQLIARGEITPSIHSPISGEVEEIITGIKDRDGYEKMIVIKNDFQENTYENYSAKEHENLKIENFLMEANLKMVIHYFQESLLAYKMVKQLVSLDLKNLK